MLYEFYRERHGTGNYVFVSNDVCVVVDSLVGTILKTFPLKQLPKNAFALLKPAKVYSCLVDTKNRSVRVSIFSSSEMKKAQPISLASYAQRDIKWCQDASFRFKFVVDLPLKVKGEKFKQVVYVMEAS